MGLEDRRVPVFYAVGRVRGGMALEKKYSFLPVSQKNLSVEIQNYKVQSFIWKRIIKLASLLL